MTHILVEKATSIPSATSHKLSNDRWIISTFAHDNNTKCYMVSEKGEQQLITNENALYLIRNHIVEGRAVSPLTVSSSEFRNTKEIVIAGTTILGMVAATGLLFFVGKDSAK